MKNRIAASEWEHKTVSEKLKSWLEDAGLVELHEALVAEHVDVDVLMELDDADMRELGFSLGQRKRLAAAIAADRANEGAKTEEAPQAEGPERRRLTVMFVDLVGSTSMSATLDVEDFRSVISAYQACCTEIIERHGGTVAKYMGDGILAYFGYPQAREHSAENGVRAGLEILGAVPRLRPIPNLALHSRIGVATGPVIVGDLIGSGVSAENQVLGDTPNLAARLQGVADEDQMFISQSTQMLAGKIFDYEEIRDISVKGIDHPISCYAVLAERDVDSRFRANQDEQMAPLSGRDQEISKLISVWQSVQNGGTISVLISADAGMGKSRLLTELEEHAATGSNSIANLYCQPQFVNSTLQPVKTYLSRLANFDRHGAPDVHFTKLTQLLSRYGMADDAALFAAIMEIAPQGVYTPPEVSPQRQRQNFYQKMALLLQAIAGDEPLLVSVEDLHWADVSTVEFLNALPTILSDKHALCVVATARPDFQGSLTAANDAQQIVLDRLPDVAAAALSRHAAGNSRLSQALVDHICRQSEGTPLYVEELTKALIESDAVREVNGELVYDASAASQTVPATLHDSLMSRLDRLGPAKEYAQIASAIGREFPLHLLAEVSNRSADIVQNSMLKLEAAEIVFPFTISGERYWSFRHALIQDAAYDSQLKSRLRELHGQIAAAIEKVTPEELTQHPEIMAHHLARASQHSRAIQFGCAAGMGALVRSANAEAVAHTDSCLKWLSAIEETPERDVLELSITAMRIPAIMQHLGYTAPEIDTLKTRVLTLLDRVGSRPEGYPNLLGLKVFHHVRSEREDARALAERFLALAEGLDDQSNLVAGLPMLAQCSWIEGRLDEAEGALRRGIALYELDAHGIHAAQYGFDTLSYCRMTLSQILWLKGRDTEASAEMNAAFEHAQAINHTNTIGLAYLYRLMLHQERGEREEAASLAREALAYCEQMGVSTPASYIAMIANWAAGNVDSSLGLFDIHTSLGAQLGLTYYRSLAVENLIDVGDAKRATEVLSPALEQAETTGEKYWMPRLLMLKAKVASLEGRQDEAVADLVASVERSRAQGSAMIEAMALEELCELSSNPARVEFQSQLNSLINDHGVERPKAVLA